MTVNDLYDRDLSDWRKIWTKTHRVDDMLRDLHSKHKDDVLFAVSVLRNVCELPFSEAKRRVWQSHLWRDELREAQWIHDVFFEKDLSQADHAPRV